MNFDECRHISTETNKADVEEMAKKSTTFERRERILALLHERPGIRVTEIASLLDVSEGTVRNDLNALAKEGQLERVRGGGIPTDDRPAHSAAFATRFRVHEPVKQRIARWAAELVEDGDTILLDASTTVYRMAQFLKDCRSLTVITNGIEVGRKLAQNSSHAVMLLGGMLNSDGVPVTDLVSDQFLRDLHIKTAFVSCSGFTPEVGLTERDIREAQLKSKMIAATGFVVALIDSSKFGKVNLAPFARTDQIAHIFTDSSLEPRWVEQLQSTCTALTVCDEDGVADYTPCAKETRHYRIGFANLSEHISFAVDVRRGLERAAQETGNVDLILADNQLDGRIALEVADRLIAARVDLVIEYQIDAQAGDVLMSKFRQANIPVIAVDIPMIGATFFGVDNYQAGMLAGRALGQWIQNNWNGRYDRIIVLEEPRAGALPAARIRGQLDGLKALIGEIPQESMLCLNSGNTTEVSEAQMTATLNSLPHERELAVICFNDDAVIGAIAAARARKRESDIVVVGQGADRRAREEMRRPGSRLIGSTAFMPEKYGEKLIQLAHSILKQGPVPPAIYMEHVFITAENIDSFYPE
jgi:ribose transport system substrate-binding protein